MIRKEWLLVFFAVAMVLGIMYYIERKENGILRERLRYKEVVTETPLEENEEIKEITTGIDSLKHNREELRKDYENKISIYVTNDVDSLLEFFEGYVSKYRFCKSVSE